MEATIAHLRDPRTPLAIIGLGYVGLPLAVEFGRQHPVVGFDINPARIAELRAGRDSTREVTTEDLDQARHLSYTSDPERLRACRIYIVTVPTPVDAHKRPDLTPLLKASETVGRVLKPGDLVISESTVYPGCTEEDCVPILERHSGLTYIHTDRRSAEPSEPRNPERRADRRRDLGSSRAQDQKGRDCCPPPNRRRRDGGARPPQLPGLLLRL